MVDKANDLGQQLSTRQIRQRDTTEETSGEYERGLANGVAGTNDRPISLRVRRRGGKYSKKSNAVRVL